MIFYIIGILLFILPLIFYIFGNKNKEILEIPEKVKVFYPFLKGCLGMYKLTGHNFKTNYEERICYKINILTGVDPVGPMMAEMCIKLLILIWGSGFLCFLYPSVNDMYVTGFFLLIIIIGVYSFDLVRDRQIKERIRQIQMEMPEFLGLLALLTNAGMPLLKALKRISQSNKKSYLYFEITLMLRQIESGRHETEAFETLARRCAFSEMGSFVSIAIQNLKKGGNELVPLLLVHSSNCWESRKNAVKKLGEEASTKLVFPMGMIFIAILLLVAAPAFIQMGGL